MGVFEGLLSTVLFVFNVLVSLAGLALFIIAIVVTVEFREYADADLFNDEYLWVPVGLAFAAGFLLMMMGMLGICGHCTKRRKVLYAHIGFTMAFLCIQIILVTQSFTSKDKIQDSAEKSIRRSLIPAYRDNKENTKKAINKLQETFDCCGGFNQTDYTGQLLDIPPSCCSGKPADCGNPGSVTPVYYKGCGKAIFDKFESHATAQIAVAITFVVLQVVAVIFSIYLVKKDSGTYV